MISSIVCPGNPNVQHICLMSPMSLGCSGTILLTYQSLSYKESMNHNHHTHVTASPLVWLHVKVLYSKAELFLMVFTFEKMFSYAPLAITLHMIKFTMCVFNTTSKEKLNTHNKNKNLASVYIPTDRIL